MKKRPMPMPSADPRSREEQEAALCDLARCHNFSAGKAREIDERLRLVPIEDLIKMLYGPDHGAFYDAEADIWIVPDRRYSGPGFGFVAIRSDRSWFTGVVPAEAFQ